ncbi:MAG: porin [Balneolales bacterium]
MKYIYTIALAALFILGSVKIESISSARAQSSQAERVVVVPNRSSVSELKLRGRIHGQFAFSDGSNRDANLNPEPYSSFELRRMRLGVQGKIYGHWSFMAEANVLSTVDLDVAMLAYTRYPEANISFGKSKPQFGLEQNTSSVSILTMERTRLDGLLNGGKPLGIRINGNINSISYYLGVYNGQMPGTGRMSAGSDSYLYNASIGLDAGQWTGSDFRIQLRSDYLHGPAQSGYYGYENAFAISGRFGINEMDLRTEYMTGTRHDNNRVNGYYFMPSWFILTETLQLVVRYENVRGDTGISLGHNRYADRVSNLYGAGNEYYAVYAGLNYYIFDDNLKFMLGAELAENNGSGDASGRATTIYSGFRMQF